MPASTKEIRRRIKSVSNTRQITKAMELVAAVKMRKAQEATLATRAYSEKAWKLIGDVSAGVDRSVHPLLAKRDVKKACVIIVSPDRGLCGSLNANIFKAAQRLFDSYEDQKIAFDVVTLGKKIKSYIVRKQYPLVAEFDGFDKDIESSDIYPISEICVKGFIEKTYDAVTLIYTDFVSTLVQNVSVRELLPLKEDAEAGELGEVGKEEEQKDKQKQEEQVSAFEYEFEPSKKELLNEMLPRLTEMQLYQAVLESVASEHSARMVAMKNASESATDLIDAFTLKFNQARQAAITQEIAEISAGMTALE